MTSSLPKRDRYTYIPGIRSSQQAILDQAFSDAIFLAVNVREPPESVPYELQKSIFNKYFPPDAVPVASDIFNRIVGGNSHTGNADFARLLVDVNDSHNVCANDKAKNYINRDGNLIRICPNFWSDVTKKTCAELPENIVSWQMTFPGDAIFNMLLGYIGTKAIEGKNIENYYLNPIKKGAPSYTGPALAMYIRAHKPEFTIFSAMNYEWYAMVGGLLQVLIIVSRLSR